MGSSVVKIGQDITEKEISSFLQEKENKLKFQNKVKEFEAALSDFSTKTDQDKNLASLQGYEEGYVKHDFADGQYIRSITMPEGLVVATKIHAKNHPFFVMKGKCSVFTENGMETIEAPYQGITYSGTKRLLYIHEECIWTTVHRTDKLNVEDVEEEIIAKNFEEKEFLTIDTKQIDGLIEQIRNKE
jgi:vacuolar-type H+-ATPase subunit I/STV1